eukprot:scaffold5048_cov102-Isochrysis_galbana.AAC.6
MVGGQRGDFDPHARVACDNHAAQRAAHGGGVDLGRQERHVVVHEAHGDLEGSGGQAGRVRRRQPDDQLPFVQHEDSVGVVNAVRRLKHHTEPACRPTHSRHPLVGRTRGPWGAAALGNAGQWRWLVKLGELGSGDEGRLPRQDVSAEGTVQIRPLEHGAVLRGRRVRIAHQVGHVGTGHLCRG